MESELNNSNNNVTNSNDATTDLNTNTNVSTVSNNSNTTNDSLDSIASAAKKLGIRRTSVKELVDCGRIKSENSNGRDCISTDSLKEFVGADINKVTTDRELKLHTIAKTVRLLGLTRMEVEELIQQGVIKLIDTPSGKKISGYDISEVLKILERIKKQNNNS